MKLLLAIILILVMAITTVSFAAEDPVETIALGTAESYAVLAGSTITNTGTTTIIGDIGLHPGTAITGYASIVHTGALNLADAAEEAEQAKTDLVTAYDDAAGRSATTIPTELGGQTLLPGVYKSASGTFELTGTLTLDAQGDANNAFIFQTTSTLVTAGASVVNPINGAHFCRIFWQVGSSATLGTNSTFVGHILALTSITATTGAKVEGQLLARNGAVTLDSNTIENELCATVVPRIQVEKFVSVDNGTTWLDANSSPGPSALVGSTVEFKYLVTNSGNTPLVDLSLADNLYDLSAAVLVDPLPAGGTFEYLLEDVTVTAGQHQNTATATGVSGGIVFSDNDVAHYLGYLPVDVPSITVFKYISLDGGTIWLNADSAPWPLIAVGSEIMFKFVTINNGNVTLTGILLTDSVFDLEPATLPDLLPVGGSFEYILENIIAETGQHQNTATASGLYGETVYSNTDDANYFGFEASLELTKAAVPQTYSAVGDIISYTFTATNTGNVTLTDLVLSESVFSGTGLTPAPLFVSSTLNSLEGTLLPGEAATYTATYSVTQADINASSVYNEATVTGYFEDLSYLAIDDLSVSYITIVPAIVYFPDVIDSPAIPETPDLPEQPALPVAFDVPEIPEVLMVPIPAIKITKYLSVDGGNTWLNADYAPGPSVTVGSKVKFKFTVTNSGNTPLTDISLADNLYDLSAAVLIDPLPAGNTFEYVLEGVTVTAGQHLNIATVTGISEGVVYSDSDNAHYWGEVSEVLAAVALPRTAGGLSVPAAEVISLFLLIGSCLAIMRSRWQA